MSKTSPERLEYIKQWQRDNRERKNLNNKAYYARRKNEIKSKYTNTSEIKKYFKELPMIDSC